MNKHLIKAYASKLTAERQATRPVSHAEAEAEIVRVMQAVARNLAPVFKFGYHSHQDIEQQGVLYALELLKEDPPRYDVARPLENFLHIHVRNRLSNFRRDNFMRLERPCPCCDPFNPPAYPCQKWADWSARNSSKQNLMRPLDMSNINDEEEANMKESANTIDDAIHSELRLLLDRELPIELRRDYLQMLDGKVIPKIRRQRVREAVIDIMRRNKFLPQPDATTNALGLEVSCDHANT